MKSDHLLGGKFETRKKISFEDEQWYDPMSGLQISLQIIQFSFLAALRRI